MVGTGVPLPFDDGHIVGIGHLGEHLKVRLNVRMAAVGGAVTATVGRRDGAVGIGPLSGPSRCGRRSGRRSRRRHDGETPRSHLLVLVGIVKSGRLDARLLLNVEQNMVHNVILVPLGMHL